MKIVVDTNILVRFITEDDEHQFQVASKLFKKCDEVIIPTPVMCELVWVLSSGYRVKPDNILKTIEALLGSPQINVNEDEVEAGLSMMRKGGDFADGVNAYTGRQMSSGNIIFASFDKKAVRLLMAQGVPALIPD